MYKQRKVILKYVLIIITVILFLFAATYYANIELKEMSEKEEMLRSCFENVTLRGINDSAQEIKLFEKEEAHFSVYIPSEMRTDVNVYFEQFRELRIGDVIYQSGDALTDIYKGSEYEMCAIDWDGSVQEKAVINFYFTVDIPTLYIESEDKSIEEVNKDKNVKAEAEYTAIDISGEVETFGKCTIKARGNTSFGFKQKSYSINLNSAESLFGMSKCSEWALLANYQNSIHQLKNKIVLDIAHMMQMPHVPESEYVNVYIDNQYNGLYLLTQKVSADGGSVQLNNTNVRSGITGPYLLEFDGRYKEEPFWFKTGKKNVVIKYPKVVQDESLEYISDYVTNVENILFSGDEKKTLEVIDLETWTSMYLMQEFFVQWDVEWASFYLYKYAGEPLLYAGPVWDFDLAYGDMYPGFYPVITRKTQWLNDCKKGWLAELDKYPIYHEAIIQKYAEKMEPILSEYLKKDFDLLVESLVSATYMNAMRWNRGEMDIRVDAEDIRSWMLDRKEFLKAFYSDEEIYNQVLFHFGWGNMSYYVKDNDILGILPMKEYGENDYLEDKEYGYGTIIGWEDTEGNQITDKEVITEDIVYYAIYQ